MFWVWGILSLVQLARPARRAWAELFALGALAWAAIPIVDAATTDRGLFHALATGDMVFAGVDIATLVIALTLALAAWRASRRPPAPKGRRTTAPRQEQLVHA